MGTKRKILIGAVALALCAPLAYTQASASESGPQPAPAVVAPVPTLPPPARSSVSEQQERSEIAKMQKDAGVPTCVVSCWKRVETPPVIEGASSFTPPANDGATTSGFADGGSIFGVDHPAGFPNYCLPANAEKNVWWFYRTDSCMYEQYYMVLVDNKGKPTGSERVRAWNWIIPNRKDDVWTYNFRMNVDEWVGTAEKTQDIKAIPTCANCKKVTHVENPSNKPLRLTPWRIQKATFKITPKLTTDVERSTFKMGILFSAPQNPETFPGVDSHPRSSEVRCDRTTVVNKKHAPGCVMADYPGLFFIDVNREKSKPWAQHVKRAQIELPDHWGLYGHGPILSRTRIATEIEDNRKVSCPRGERPDGLTCDEYPFASTRQGGGFVGRSRISVDWITGSSNSSGGGLLGAFYRDQRMLNKNPFWVIPN